MSLKDPEKKLETQNELFRLSVKEIFDDVENYRLFNIVRSDDSTIEKTRKMLKDHFGLK